MRIANGKNIIVFVKADAEDPERQGRVREHNLML